MGLFFAPNLTRQRKFYAAFFFPNCGNPARPPSRINTLWEAVMDSGITNNIESLLRLLTIQMIFRIIVPHSIINSILTNLNYCQSSIQEIKKRYLSCPIDLMRTAFFHCLSTFETVNKLTPPTLTAGQLYIYKHYSGHFLLYQKNCAYDRAKTKAHCKAKRNIFIRIEIQAGNPESAGFWSQHFLVHWTVFCLAARAWSCSTAWRHKDCSSRVLDLVSFIVHCCKGAFPLIFFFSLIGWNVLLISCRLKLS